MDPATRRLRLLLRGLMVVFALGAVDFLVFPNLTIKILNASGSAFGLPALEWRAHEFWAVLAVAYMVLVTAFCWEATRRPGVEAQPVRFLIIGKTASSLVSLLYFVIAVQAFAFLANFLVDGLIAAVTWFLYRQAFSTARASAPASPTRDLG
jgi:uncharacterized membrane protein